MNLHSEDSEVPDVLSAIGQVNPPASHVLENARDVLWSAIAEEMLSNAEARLRPGIRGRPAAAGSSTAPGQQSATGPTAPQRRSRSVTCSCNRSNSNAQASGSSCQAPGGRCSIHCSGFKMRQPPAAILLTNC